MDIGVPELLIILTIVLLIFGPGRIAMLSREISAGIREFRQEVKDQSDPVEQETIGDD